MYLIRATSGIFNYYERLITTTILFETFLLFLWRNFSYPLPYGNGGVFSVKLSSHSFCFIDHRRDYNPHQVCDLCGLDLRALMFLVLLEIMAMFINLAISKFLSKRKDNPLLTIYMDNE